nr:MAG TPA: hypothetical protein [Caudoviricetes sp.]
MSKYPQGISSNHHTEQSSMKISRTQRSIPLIVFYSPKYQE